uniref:Uncharacterized protein n=1 Tax=Arundo donax TaxID=35708 RepID=A0A0A8YNF3_ARUDO
MSNPYAYRWVHNMDLCSQVIVFEYEFKY